MKIERKAIKELRLSMERITELLQELDDILKNAEIKTPAESEVTNP
jgi:hypothetical protein